jgi:hypothetical protein
MNLFLVVTIVGYLLSDCAESKCFTDDFNRQNSEFAFLATTILPTIGYTPFANSQILSTSEAKQLYSYIRETSDTLLYRGSRDGFTPRAFHSKCDGKANTVTIIKTDKNYVFGGYTASPWKSDRGTYGSDSTAFIFSLRKNGLTKVNPKFKVVDAARAIYNDFRCGPAFGSYEGSSFSDIMVGFNVDYFNYCDFGASYNSSITRLPYGSDDARSFLAGSFYDWVPVEIEVYQVTKA